MSEAEKKLSSYRSLGELFVRRLRPGAREIQHPPLHPCDSTITTFGEVDNSTLIGAKGVSYSLEKFLNTKDYSCTSGVSTTSGVSIYRYFITYYLSPRDYHRVHSPVDGVIKRAYKISGQLWPVNRTMVKLKKDLFIVNERLIVEIETREGKKVCVVFVGATNVGCIKVSFDSKFDGGLKNYSLNISAGDELGMFSLGSTVVVLYSESLNNISSGYVYCNSSINF